MIRHDHRVGIVVLESEEGVVDADEEPTEAPFGAREPSCGPPGGSVVNDAGRLRIRTGDAIAATSFALPAYAIAVLRRMRTRPRMGSSS
jgi:hypothetical protein